MLERALFVVVQAKCLEGRYRYSLYIQTRNTPAQRHRDAFEAMKATYGASRRIPARLLGLWWLLNDNCTEALDTALAHCERVDDPAALLALLVQQAYGRKGHGKLAEFIRTSTSSLIGDDVRQVRAWLPQTRLHLACPRRACSTCSPPTTTWATPAPPAPLQPAHPPPNAPKTKPPRKLKTGAAARLGRLSNLQTRHPRCM